MKGFTYLSNRSKVCLPRSVKVMYFLCYMNVVLYSLYIYYTMIYPCLNVLNVLTISSSPPSQVPHLLKLHLLKFPTFSSSTFSSSHLLQFPTFSSSPPSQVTSSQVPHLLKFPTFKNKQKIIWEIKNLKPVGGQDGKISDTQGKDFWSPTRLRRVGDQ